MADIQKLTYPYFADNTTALNASNLNPIVETINAIIDKVNGSTPATVATPTITISGTSATIACSTSGATIYYTTNGNTPTSSSTQYTGAITLTGACTIKAIAIKDGVSSSVASQSYSPSGTVTAPTIYIRDLAIIMDAESGATIRYTTDGTDPTSSSTQYTGAFTNASNCTVKAKAFKNGQSSSVTSASFTAPSSSELAEAQIVVEGSKVTLLSNGVGVLKYTLGDSTSYTNYTEPFTLSEATQVIVRTVDSSNSSTYINTSIMFTGTEPIATSVRVVRTESYLYINRTLSSTTKIAMKTSTSNLNTRFYKIAQGRKYNLKIQGLSGAALAYWGYLASMPETIVSEQEYDGYVDVNQEAADGASNVKLFDITALDYQYLVTSGSLNVLVCPLKELVKE